LAGIQEKPNFSDERVYVSFGSFTWREMPDKVGCWYSSMKRTLKIRILVLLAVIVLVACCGTGAGYLLGRGLALRQAKHRLQQDVERAVAEQTAFLKETRATLEMMNASTYPYCSEAEIGYFRKLVFQTDYMRDGGRIRDGKIDCSVTLGAADLPYAQLQPAYSTPDGAQVYKATGQPQVRDQLTLSVQSGDSYVVINSGTGRRLDKTQLQFIVTMTAALDRSPSRLLSKSPQPDDAIFTRNGLSRQGDTLYFTLCTPASFSCTTTHMTIPDAMLADRTELRILMALGGLIGALFGIVLSIFYRRNLSMEQQLRRAIRKDQLRVEYQQIVSLASGRIVGTEALARWTDEEGFAVGPDVFVKVAEEYGFVGSITRLVVRHILRDFAATLRAQPDFRLSMNVAATDLSDPLFLPMLESALKRAEVPAESLIIEITESSTARSEAAIAAILLLHQRGHSVHVDDFGTGYSSLSYLHDLSVDAIKIDRTFTRSIGTEAVTATILPQILAMAGALNLHVIAEGIETRQQADYFAVQAQPILGQGWLFGRSVSAVAFQSLLAEDRKMQQTASAVLDPA
jgi:sensor c-di-GMP phosphodiesterase-like protein